MKFRNAVALCAIFAASGAFARGTRSIAVSANATDGVVRGATLTFSPDDGTVAFSAGEASSVSAFLQTTETFRVRMKGITVIAR